MTIVSLHYFSSECTLLRSVQLFNKAFYYYFFIIIIIIIIIHALIRNL